MPATTTNGIPYPLAADNNNVPADMQALAEYIDSRIWKPGDVRATVRSAPDTGWLAFGQTITNGQSLHPALWAAIPVSYRSGSNIVLPAVSDAAIIATVSSVGAVTGSHSLTLSTANLPVHSHTIPAHSHTASSASAGEHSHNTGVVSGFAIGSADRFGLSNALVGGVQVTFVSRHTAALASVVGGTGILTTTAGAHTHTITVNSGGGGASGNVGSGTAISVKGRTLELNLYIKT